MAIKDTVLGPIDWLRVRLGLKPRCSWVQDRFCEYHTWELEPAELSAVELHLAACPGCAREWRKTEGILDQLEAESPIADQLNELSSEDFVAGMLARIDEYEFERANRARKRWTPLRGIKDLAIPLKTMPRFAAALLLLVSVSALAYIAPELAQIISGSADQAESVPSQKCSQNDSSSVVTQSSSMAPVGHFADQYTRANLPDTFKLPQQLAAPDLSDELDALTAEAQVEMLLPHTEAEWEAWARKEYPHIMWVYDVLTLPEYGYNWDGKPVYIPEWANKIWTDEATKPTGWRALIYYSGEICQFHYPMSVDAPNVRPSMHAIKLAAIVAGYNCDLDSTGKSQLPQLKFSDINVNIYYDKTFVLINKSNYSLDVVNITFMDIDQDSNVTIAYGDRILNDQKMLRRSMIYFAAISDGMPDYNWGCLNRMSRNVLVNMISKKNYASCENNNLSILRSLLLRHWQIRKSMKNFQLVNQVKR